MSPIVKRIGYWGGGKVGVYQPRRASPKANRGRAIGSPGRRTTTRKAWIQVVHQQAGGVIMSFLTLFILF